MPTVLAAHTSLLVPIALTPDGTWGDCGVRAERFLARRRPVVGAEAGEPGLWAPAPLRNEKLLELDPPFWRLLGATASPWSARRLRLDATTRQWFDGAELVHRTRPTRTGFRVRAIELWLFPLDTGAVAVELQWEEMALQELVDTLACMRPIQGRGGAPWRWRFRGGGDSGAAGLDGAFGPDGIELAALARWLLGDEGGITPSRSAQHHSCVVVDGPLAGGELTDALFRLRRAYDTSQQAPEGEGGDRVCALRANRHLGLSREGIVSLSWPVGPGEARTNWELRQWPGVFEGVYRPLALHAVAERTTLARLGELTAAPLAAMRDRADLEAARDGIAELVWRLVRYTVTLAGTDSGGLADYSWFFRSYRDVLGSPPYLAELRAEVQELAALVESTYQREREEVERRQEAADRARDEAHRREQRAVERVAPLVIAVSLVGGVLGADNQFGLGHWSFLAAVTAASLLIAGVVRVALGRLAAPPATRGSAAGGSAPTEWAQRLPWAAVKPAAAPTPAGTVPPGARAAGTEAPGPPAAASGIHGWYVAAVGGGWTDGPASPTPAEPD